MSSLPADAEVTFADAARQIPLYRQRAGEPLWYEYLPESKTVYFQFRGYPPYPEFLQFSAGLLQFVEKNPTGSKPNQFNESSGEKALKSPRSGPT